MSAAATHRIQRLHLEVDFNGSEASGLAFQSSLSEWCSNWLAAALEQAMNRYAPAGDLHWTLDRLDVQIDGAIHPDKLEAELPKLLHAALEKALLENNMPAPGQAPGRAVAFWENQIPADTYTGSQLQTSSRHTWEAFCHFLRTGWFPWPFRLPEGQTLESLVRAIWQKQDQRSALIPALRETLATPEARRRLVRQFSPARVQEIAETLAPNQTKTVRQITAILRTETSSRASLPALENHLWESALAIGITSNEVFSIAGILQRTFQEGVPAESAQFLRELMIGLSGPAKRYNIATNEAGRRALLFALQYLLDTPDASVKPDLPDERIVLQAKSVAAPPDNFGSTQENDIHVPDPGQRMNLKFLADEYFNSPRRHGGTESASADVKPPCLRASVVKNFSSKRTARDHSTAPVDYATEGIYVENAGLILLHPFFPLFFEATGVNKDGQITDSDKALALLHYLVSGENTAPEHELILPKILCGLPPHAVAGPVQSLNENDIEESINLLQTAIGYWESLKNTSPDGLRDTFLRRPGKISRRDNDWLVQVERQSFDILLDDLPWGISVVQFPWMTELVWVEWG